VGVIGSLSRRTSLRAFVRGGGLWLGMSVLLLILTACNQPPTNVGQTAGSEPKIRATVVTIRTTLQPANKSYTHTLVIANDRARSGDEVDQWRLIDMAQKRVTFVDDLTKTYRSVPFTDLIATHRAGMTQSVPDGMPRAQFVVTSVEKTLQGVAAKQSTIRLGGYHRELWIASHPLIPQGLFAMLQAGAPPPSSPIAAVMRAADEALLGVKGFPLVDHSELPFENKNLIVDHTVVKIEQRDVPASWLNVSRDYKEVMPATAPSASPRPAS
jgi:hypothetical protein